MTAKRLLYIAILMVGIVSLDGQPPAADEPGEPRQPKVKSPAKQARSATLDGKRKTFVVVGYSTSFRWPDLLQAMLDQHAGKAGVYHVANASVGGSPVAKWLGLTNARDRARTFGAMERDWFKPGTRRAGRPKPSHALLQQSLQWLFGSRRAGIRSAKDTTRIQAGADAFAKLAKQLHTMGVGSVHISTHIFKVGMEPAIENEKFALAALGERKIPYVHAGPALWKPTRDAHPAAFARDRVHPNEQGSLLMAIAWYETLAGAKSKPSVVTWIEQHHAKVKASRRGRR